MKLRIIGPVIDHETDWADFRHWIDGTHATLRFAYAEDELIYEICAVDGSFHRVVAINKGSADAADFEQHFKTEEPIDAKTKDGRTEVRITTAKRTTNFNLRVFSFYTATAGSVHNVSAVTGADMSDVTLTLQKQVDGQWVSATDTDAERTVIDFEPAYSYEIIGGFMDVPKELQGGTTDQWFVSAIGVPDYSPEYGGSVNYITEVNLEAVVTSRVSTDGRAVVYMAHNYNGAPHTNKLRFVVRHPAGAKKRFQISVEHFV